MRKLLIGLLMVLGLLLMPTAVMAQDGVPPDSVAVPEVVVTGVAVGVALILMLLGGALIGLYRSMPPVVQTLFAAIIPPLVDLAKTPVERTPTKIDDKALDEIIDWLEQQGLVRREVPLPPRTQPPNATEATPK